MSFTLQAITLKEESPFDHPDVVKGVRKVVAVLVVLVKH